MKLSLNVKIVINKVIMSFNYLFKASRLYLFVFALWIRWASIRTLYSKTFIDGTYTWK